MLQWRNTLNWKNNIPRYLIMIRNCFLFDLHDVGSSSRTRHFNFSARLFVMPYVSHTSDKNIYFSLFLLRRKCIKFLKIIPHQKYISVCEFGTKILMEFSPLSQITHQHHFNDVIFQLLMETLILICLQTSWNSTLF